MQKVEILTKGIEWSEKSNQKFLSVNLSGLDEASIINVVLDYSEELKNNGINNTSSFIDLTNVKINYHLLSIMNKFSKGHQKYIKKCAVIGLNTYTAIFYRLYMELTDSRAKLFKSKQDAIDYLID